MVARVGHRGPDGVGYWTSPEDGLAFGHSRLKVIDLTEAAHQPMQSDDGEVTLIYNGEIYNFRELRDELSANGAAFRSTGDTAVLLELCRRDPQLAFLNKLNGMFAFAVWHAPTKTLTLVRDRTGVKPLLYAEEKGDLVFGSEMAAVRAALGSLTIDPHAVYQLLSLGFILAPRTIFREVRKLRPGHLLRYERGKATVEKWASDPPASSSVSEFDDACRRVRELFGEAVARRLIADVPVGVFLSGGIDSAIVTAEAVRRASGRVKTFSVTFPGHSFYDEGRFSRAVAEMQATDHTELPLSLDDVRRIIPTVQHHLGEPFADSSALPTYLLSKLTRSKVTVALSGDGADELFAGYNRYAAATLIERYGWVARSPLYGMARKMIETLPVRRERRLGSIIGQLKRAVRSMDSRPEHRYANWMRTSDNATLAMLLHDPAQSERIVEAIVCDLWEHRGSPKEGDDLNNHLRTEWQTSLPDDMLTKIDLMSMAHGLEVRSPFLDKDLVDLVFPMPAQWKLSGWKKKHLLIEAFKRDLPEILHDRPKKGFEVPVGPWLRGPLNGYARELIAADRCFFGNLLSREGAMQLLEDHTAGRADHNFCLWALVSLLAWQQEHARDVAIGPRRDPILA